jgi:hypothetical protein
VFKLVSQGLISNVSVLIVALILVIGTINLGEHLVLASTTEGEEGGGDGDGGEGTTEEETEGEQGTEPSSEVPQDDDSTEDVPPVEDIACPAIAYEGPTYTDENGCPAPCPPPPTPGSQDTNVPEGCLQSTEEQIPPGTQSPEEQTALPADTATPPPPETGPPLKIDTDADGDGVNDAQDNCPPYTQEDTLNPDQKDTDGDGVGDVCDTDQEPGPDEQTDADTDGDGLLGSADNCPSNSNPDQLDSDGDGIGDACSGLEVPIPPDNFSVECTPPEVLNPDTGNCEFPLPQLPPLPVDTDGDGVADSSDNCPALFNPDQKRDPTLLAPGVIQFCWPGQEPGPDEQTNGPSGTQQPGPDEQTGIPDLDNDGVADSSDNCPSASNDNQQDSDNDGKGDVCDDPPDIVVK